jgi:hypothetical protein
MHPPATDLLAPTGDDALLEGILASATFERSPKLKDLLRYLWRQNANEVTEYGIATQALGRPTSFDPQTDASTRVTVARLRQKLDDYYAAEGQSDPRRFVLPAGTYRLAIEEHEPVSETIDNLRRSAGKWRALCLGAGAFSVALMALAAFLAVGRSGKTPERVLPPLPKFWQAFVANGKPVVIALPTPVFHWFGKARVVVRDPVINDYDATSHSASLGALRERWGESVLLQNFAVLPDVEAAIHLVSYLQARGVNTSVLATGDLTPATMEKANVVLLGIPGTSKVLDGSMARLNFVMRPGVGDVVSKKPHAGEPSTFQLVIQSPERQVLPGIVALTPDATTGSNVIMLAGRATKSAALLLTLSHELDSVEEIRRKTGASDQFELVFKTELDGRNVLRTWPVVCRPVR